MMTKLSNTALNAFAAAALTFLYIPVVVVILFSFNDNRLMKLPLSGFTLKWYEALYSNDVLTAALLNSLYVSFFATVISLIVGTVAAFALHGHEFPGKGLFRKAILMPISLPGIIIGIAILNFSMAIGLKLGLSLVIFGHTSMLLAIVVTQVFARLESMDQSLQDAAGDLGASPWQTFMRVTLPNIASALLGSALLSFTVSFDDVPITFFLTGRENTLPMYIYSSLRRGPSPEINAVSTLILVVSLILIIFSVRMLANPAKRAQAQ
jgi:spermidine/putrescine transport system permease protein